MANRKYESFILNTEDGESFPGSYGEGFAAYQRTEGSATLYGIDAQGEVSTIMSK